MSYEFKGTPGPWAVLTEPGSFENRDILRFDVKMDNGHSNYVPICSGYGNLNKYFPSIAETEANAHLIAAAPDLLNALIELENLADLFSTPEVSSALESEVKTVSAAMDAARQAIHKALNL